MCHQFIASSRDSAAASETDHSAQPRRRHPAADRRVMWPMTSRAPATRSSGCPTLTYAISVGKSQLLPMTIIKWIKVALTPCSRCTSTLKQVFFSKNRTVWYTSSQVALAYAPAGNPEKPKEEERKGRGILSDLLLRNVAYTCCRIVCFITSSF